MIKNKIILGRLRYIFEKDIMKDNCDILFKKYAKFKLLII